MRDGNSDTEVGGLYYPKARDNGQEGQGAQRHAFRAPEPRVSILGMFFCCNVFIIRVWPTLTTLLQAWIGWQHERDRRVCSRDHRF